MKIMGPAGSREAFDAALTAGADEIYLGLAGYGARRFAANFSPDELCRALDDAHRLGAAVNLTLNTILSDAEYETVEPDLRRLYTAGLDAVIVQDFGVAARLFESFPDLAVHASTQMALANADEILWAERNGFRRVVLPRELSFEEIGAIRKATKVELEVFTSGALCLACSGKCLLSSFVGGRSGNRGACAQPCRQHYERISEGDGPARGYLLSLTDQRQGAETIQRLVDAGVGVIKIEGRMKSPAYVFEAVRYYRRLVDSLEGVSSPIQRKRYFLKNADDEKSPAENTENAEKGRAIEAEKIPSRLERLFNRGYGPGYFDAPDPEILHPNYSSDMGAEIGRVENGAILLTETVVFGDGILYLDADYQKLGGTQVNKITRLPRGAGKWRESVEEASPGDAVLFEFPPPAEARFVHRTFDHRLQKEIAHAIENTRRHRPIAASLRAKVGEPLALTLEIPERNLSLTRLSETPLEESKKRKTDPAELADALDRFGETPFTLEKCRIDADENAFVPKSALNQLRQKTAADLEALVLEHAVRSARPESVSSENNSPRSAEKEFSPSKAPIFSVSVRTAAQALCCKKLGIEKIYLIARPALFESAHGQRLGALDRQFGPAAEELFPGIRFSPLAGTLAEAIWFESRKIPFAVDSCFNIGNLRAAEFLLNRFASLETLFLSTELSEKTVLALAETLAPKLRARSGAAALSVFGHPAGMLTRKTLFESDRTELLNQDGRRFVVVRNSSWYADGSALTGSTVYYAPPNDILASAERLHRGGIDELRFDFTIESPDEIERAIGRARSADPREKLSGLAYGFDHPIF